MRFRIVYSNTMSTAGEFYTTAYADGEYSRPRQSDLMHAGGVLVESSNEDNSTWSYSPTEVWRFPDGSALRVGYGIADIVP